MTAEFRAAHASGENWASVASELAELLEKEPLPEGHKLRFVQNALILPHLGYVTAENYSIFYTQMIENLEACVEGKPIRLIEN